MVCMLPRWVQEAGLTPCEQCVFPNEGVWNHPQIREYREARRREAELLQMQREAEPPN